MDSIDQNVFSNIFSFGESVEIEEYRKVSKGFISTIDTNDLVFQGRKGRIISKNKSVGLTSVIYRDLRKDSCIVCRGHTRSKHPIYKIPVCKACNSSFPFIMRSVLSLCKKYFIKQDEIENNLIVKTGRGFKILESDVEKSSIKKHGYLGLSNLIEKRESRSHKLKSARLRARWDRTKELRSMFNNYIGAQTHQYKNFNVLMEILNSFQLSYWDVLGDFIKLKIYTRTSKDDIFSHLCSLVRMLDILFEKDLILETGNLTEYMSEYSKISYLFKRYTIDSTGFKSLAHQFYLAQRSFNARFTATECDSDDENGDHVEKLERICQEEGVDCNNVVFDEYIDTGEGDPHILVRRVKKYNFLVDNGYVEFYNGCESCTANIVLNITHGYDPMI